MTTSAPRLIELLELVAPPEGPEHHLAPRPRSLKGKVLALFDDNEPNGREILEDLGEMLTARQGVAGVRYRNLNSGIGYDLFNGRRVSVDNQSLEDAARSSDAAIVGVGH